MLKFFNLYKLAHFRKCLFWNVVVAVLIILLMHFIINDTSLTLLIKHPEEIYDKLRLSAPGILLAYPWTYQLLLKYIKVNSLTIKSGILVGVENALMIALITTIIVSVAGVSVTLFEYCKSGHFHFQALLFIPILLITSPMIGAAFVVVMLPASISLGAIFCYANYCALKNVSKDTIDQALKLTEKSKS